MHEFAQLEIFYCPVLQGGINGNNKSGFSQTIVWVKACVRI